MEVWVRLVTSYSWWSHNCSPPGSSVHGIPQVRILEWVDIPFSRGSSWPRTQTQVSCIADRFFTIWATLLIRVWVLYSSYNTLSHEWFFRPLVYRNVKHTKFYQIIFNSVSALLVTTKFGFPLITLTSNPNFKLRLLKTTLRLDNSLGGFI